MRMVAVEYQRSDERGTLTQLSSGIWKQINLLEIKAGHTFGNHYHKHKTELFYVVNGVVTLEVTNDVDLTAYSNTVEPSTAFIIEPYDRHTITAITDCVLVELLSEPYNQEDIFA